MVESAVWESREGARVYVSTADGVFERWMDEHDPAWRHESSDAITFLRDLWQAAQLRREVS